MLDKNGKRIARGSKLLCVNNIEPGKIYTVKTFAGKLCLEHEDDPLIPLDSFETENKRLVDFIRLNNPSKPTYTQILNARCTHNLAELGCEYGVPVESIPEDTKTKMETDGFYFDDEDISFVFLNADDIDKYELYDVVCWNICEENPDYIHEMMAPAEKYLVYAQGCRWDGASGYSIKDDLEDAFRRDYEVTINPVNITARGKAMLCREASHDVPMGSYTVVIGLTASEAEKLENAYFQTVKAFAERYIEKLKA